MIRDCTRVIVKSLKLFQIDSFVATVRLIQPRTSCLKLNFDDVCDIDQVVMNKLAQGRALLARAWGMGEGSSAGHDATRVLLRRVPALRAGAPSAARARAPGSADRGRRLREPELRRAARRGGDADAAPRGAQLRVAQRRFWPFPTVSVFLPV